jgi:predicted metal-dependent peptidase
MPPSVIEQVSKATIKLLLQEPFFGHLCSGLRREISARHPQATLTLNADYTLTLAVHPEHWASLDEAQRVGTIKRQLLHIALKHPLRAEAFAHMRLFHIAADLVVNQLLHHEQLDPEAITLSQLPNLPPNQSVDHYYQLLRDMLQQPPETSSSDQEDPQDSKRRDAQRRLQELLREEHAALSAHDAWEQVEALDSSQRQLVSQHIDGLIQHTHQRTSPEHWDSLPAALRRELESLLATLKPRVDWRRALRLFASSSRKTTITNTLRRPSKRYGTTPGIKLLRHNKLLVALDTSGSISMPALLAFFSELEHIWRQGADITIVECDAQIHRVYTYRGTPPGEVLGGGFTSLDPPLEYANQTLRPDAILYFTDAYAAAPTITPRAPILWLIWGPCATPDSPYWRQLPGRKIALTPT